MTTAPHSRTRPAGRRRCDRGPLSGAVAVAAALGLAALLLLAVLPVAADEPATSSEEPAANASGGDELPAALAHLTSSMDPSADPCQDFYQYACGGWLASTERPADEAIWGRSFSVIHERNREVVKEILEDAAAHPDQSADHARLGHYYAACMDEEAVEERGVTPLAPHLERIASVDGPESLMTTSGHLYRIGAEPLLGLDAIPDFKDPDLNIAFVSQGGLGMPNRDYYVSDEEDKKKLLAAYQDHVATMLGFLGEDAETAARHAEAVVAFETQLAEASRPAAEMRQVDKLYHRLDLSGLQELTPDLPWKSFFAATGHPDVTQINVATPEFFEALGKAVAEADADTLRAYLRWHAVHGTATLLSSDVVEAHFDLYGRKLSGQKEMQPRWKRCVAATEDALGEVVGKLYVERRFAGDSKEVALEMIGDIEAAFEADLPELAWMDPETRKRAIRKARAVQDKIGYPDRWRDYSGLETKPDDLFANAVAARGFELDFDLAKVGEPVDPNEWGMDPQQVNAYYHPLHNEIVFPAGILQPPFFHRDAPAAMNYGGIGAVIGHELTHGFDDAGRKFAPDGQLREWWEPEASKRFEERAQCVRDFYSQYEVEPGVPVNGDLTAGENIADLGGLKQAYHAFQRWEERHGELELPGDLDAEQVLFVAFGQVWCAHASPQYQRMQVTLDPHSPARFRTIGPVTHNPDFAEAFSCEPGDAMVAKKRCEVW